MKQTGSLIFLFSFLLAVFADAEVVFYLPLDGDTVGFTGKASISAENWGVPVYQERIRTGFGALGIMRRGLYKCGYSGNCGPSRYTEGVKGKAGVFGHKIEFPADEFVSPEAGTLSCWIKSAGRNLPDDAGVFFELEGFFNVSTRDLAGSKWNDGEWHHLAATYNRKAGTLSVYLDGGKITGKTLTRKGKVPARFTLIIGSQPAASEPFCILDEFVVHDEDYAPGNIGGLRGKDVKMTPVLSSILDSVSDKRPVLPKPIDWGLKSAVTVRTTTRRKQCLNGYWRFFPCVDYVKPEFSSPLYIRMPGLMKKKGRVKRQRVFDGNFAETDIKNDFKHAYLERDFDIPQLAPAKKVFVNFENFEMSARAIDAFLNKRYVGSFFYRGPFSFDVTKHLVRGTNRLTLLVRNGDTMMKDVWLEFQDDSDIRLEEMFITPSVRKKSLDLTLDLANCGGLKAAYYAVEAKGIGFDDSRSFGPVKVSLKGTAKERVKISFRWEDPKLWSPEEPNLYNLTLKRVDEGGNVIDQNYPERFGFREFWIEGSHFVLNGNPYYLRGDSGFGAGYYLDSDSSKAHTESFAQRFKAVGYNASFTWAGYNDQVVLDVLDEQGLLYLFKDWYGIINPYVGSEFFHLTEPARKRRIYDAVRTFGNHPSVVIWMDGMGGADFWAFYPKWMGKKSFQKVIEANNDVKTRYDAAQLAVKWFKQVDPAQRVVTSFASFLDEVKAGFNYQNFGTPLMAREEWPREWAKDPDKPVLVSEFMFPCSTGWAGFTKIGEDEQYRYRKYDFTTEWEAMFFGDDAYLAAPKTRAASQTIKIDPFTGRERELGVKENWWKRADSFRIKKLFLPANIRAWRTWGVNFIAHVELLWYYFQVSHESLTVPDRTREPGYYLDDGVSKKTAAFSKIEKITELGEVARANCSPLLVYIGGARGDFVRKDHCFFSEKEISKSIVMINDSTGPIQFSGVCSLEDEQGAEVNRKPFNYRVGAGLRRIEPIEFTAPAARVKKDYRIRLQVAAPGWKTEDTLAFQVFPATRTPAFKRQVRTALYDPRGDTASLLKKAKVSFTVLDGKTDLSKLDLLVIGRASPAAEARELLKRLKINEAVKNGLNLLVFEQKGAVTRKPSPLVPWEKNERNLEERTAFGLRLELGSFRRCFIRQPGHEILKGFSDKDFAHWSGESDIIEPYPKPSLPELDPLSPKYNRQAFRHYYLRRYWHWGNKGIVSTFSFEKPHVGPFRSLMDCGFDLAFSALLEAEIGAGKVLYCQLDLTNRYSADPVATEVANRILEYMAKPARRRAVVKVAYFGGDRGFAELKRTGIIAKRLKEFSHIKNEKFVVVDLSSDETRRLLLKTASTNKKTIDVFVKNGGTLFLQPLREEDDIRVSLLDNLWPWGFRTSMLRREEFWRAQVQGHEFSGSFFDGLGPSDFFFREIRNVPIVETGPEEFREGDPRNGVKTDPAVVLMMPVLKGRIVFCQISPRSYEKHPETSVTRGQYVKAFRIMSTLIRNLAKVEEVDFDLTVKEYNKDYYPYLCSTWNWDVYFHYYW